MLLIWLDFVILCTGKMEWRLTELMPHQLKGAHSWETHRDYCIQNLD